MNNKKRSKLKSAGRYNHYKSYGWLARVVYRLRSDKTIRHYLATGKYERNLSGVPYELLEGEGFWVMDLVISSTVRKSRVKNIPYGCQYINKDQLSYWMEHGQHQEE